MGSWYERRGRRWFADGPAVARQLEADGWSQVGPAGAVDVPAVDAAVVEESTGPDAAAARKAAERRRSARRRRATRKD